MNCLDKDDFLNLKVNCRPVDICCPCEEIEHQLEIAHDFVECFTGTRWCPEPRCEVIDGSGTNRLFLNRVTSDPLISITQISEVGCNTGCGYLGEITNCRNWLEMNCGGIFPCGSKNIEVCGIWGDEMPAAIRQVILMLTLEALAPGTSGLSSIDNVKSATWEDFRYSAFDRDLTENGLSTGFFELDQMLNPYISTVANVGISIVPQDENCAMRYCGQVKHKSTYSHKSCKKC